MIKAVIFDMDGVLIEAKEWHYEALNRALSLFGYAINRIDHLTAYDGLPTARKLEMLSLERGLSPALHGFINEMKQAYTMEMVYTQCRPRFIHEFALSQLKEAGYRLGVASNSIRRTVEVMMDCSRLRPYLDVLLSNEDVARAKPRPDIYLKAAELLGLPPHECLVVEDNENGLAAARAAGTHVLAVKEVTEVNIANIRTRIERLDAEERLAT